MAKYKTTVTEKDGSKTSGYIENGKSYYDDGREINAGASVVDSTGRTWTKGGATTSSNKTSSGGSSGKSNYETWEANGRTYVDGIDVGPAGTKIDTSSAAINAAYNSTGKYSNSNQYRDMQDEYNPYEDQIERYKKAYEDLEAQIREKNRLAVEQGTNRLNAQKSNINQAADENARQAYVQYMQSQKALPQQLASQGVSGGATETANLGLQTAYQNNVNAINQNKANRLQEIDNAIVDLQNTGDLSTVEQVLANNQAALDAYSATFDKGVGYNQWANQFNANRQDTMADQAYRDKVYADQMTQQQLENQWYERNYNDSKKKGLINNGNDGGYKTANKVDVFNDALAMLKTEGWTAEDVMKFVWGQGLSETDEMDVLGNLGLLDSNTPVENSSNNSVTYTSPTTLNSLLNSVNLSTPKLSTNNTTKSTSVSPMQYLKDVSEQAKDNDELFFKTLLNNLKNSK